MPRLPSRLTAPAASAPRCRTAEELYLHLGAAIGYWRGDIKGLMEDIGEQLQARRVIVDSAVTASRAQLGVSCIELPTGRRSAQRLLVTSTSMKTVLWYCTKSRWHAWRAGALRPTMFCGVPRVFDRIYAGVMQKAREQRRQASSPHEAVTPWLCAGQPVPAAPVPRTASTGTSAARMPWLCALLGASDTAASPRMYRHHAVPCVQVSEGSFLKKALFNWGFQRKLHFLNKGLSFDKVRSYSAQGSGLKPRSRTLFTPSAAPPMVLCCAVLAGRAGSGRRWHRCRLGLQARCARGVRPISRLAACAPPCRPRPCLTRLCSARSRKSSAVA